MGRLLIVPLDGSEPRYEDDFSPIEEAAPAYYRISKMTPWLRMSDEEAMTMRQAMDAAPVRLQEIYKAAPYLQSDDELWPTLWAMLATNLSPERANYLLAPET